MAPPQGGGGRAPPWAANKPTFVDIVVDRPQPLPEVKISVKEPKLVQGERCFIFTEEEIQKTAASFRFAVVLKFLRRRPYLDVIRGFIKNRWGLKSMTVVGQLMKARSVLVRLTSEEDFITAMIRENKEINGVPYNIFHWTPDFSEEEEVPH